MLIVVGKFGKYPRLRWQTDKQTIRRRFLISQLTSNQKCNKQCNINHLLTNYLTIVSINVFCNSNILVILVLQNLLCEDETWLCTMLHVLQRRSVAGGINANVSPVGKLIF